MARSKNTISRWWNRSKTPLIVGGILFAFFLVLARLDGGWGAIGYILMGILSLSLIPGWILANRLYEDNRSWLSYALVFTIPIVVWVLTNFT